MLVSEKSYVSFRKKTPRNEPPCLFCWQSVQGIERCCCCCCSGLKMVMLVSEKCALTPSSWKRTTTSCWYTVQGIYRFCCGPLLSFEEPLLLLLFGRSFEIMTSDSAYSVLMSSSSRPLVPATLGERKFSVVPDVRITFSRSWKKWNLKC